MDLGLNNKIAVVTGSSEGIGKATATALAQEGAKVAICARRPDQLESAAQEIRSASGGEVLAVPTDVMQPDQLEAFLQRVIDTWGGIDILVNNAGTAASGAFESVSDETWKSDMELKLFGAIRTSRIAIPVMRARGGGRIINITQILGKQPPANSVPTSVTRAAGIALTKELSKELAKDKILVNTICVNLVKSGQMARSAQRNYPGNERGRRLGRDGEERALGSYGRGGRSGERYRVPGLRPRVLPDGRSHQCGRRRQRRGLAATDNSKKVEIGALA